jgi:hypothetical protein
MKEVSTVFALALIACEMAVGQPANAVAQTKFRDRSNLDYGDLPAPAADGPQYQVGIFVAGRERRLVSIGNEWFAPVRPGEAYRIRVRNHDTKPVMLVLTVDGRNTLPEQTPKFRLTPPPPAWRLQAGREYEVAGFYSQTGANARYQEFVVAEAAGGAPPETGVIRAGFRAPLPKGGTLKAPPKGKGLQTRAGVERNAQTGQYNDVISGDLLAEICIRCVTPEELARRQAQNRGR